MADLGDGNRSDAGGDGGYRGGDGGGNSGGAVPLEVVTIEPRFCGPQHSGNGGYVSGLVGKCALGAGLGPVGVMLRKPPPLNTPLDLVAVDEKLEMRHGDVLIAEASPARVKAAPPPTPREADILAARKAYEAWAVDHPLAHCFVCGTARKQGDGLRIFSGAVPSAKAPQDCVNADFWVPADDLADPFDGLVAPEFLWAALDCPSFYALRTQAFCLLGALAVEIHRRPAPGGAVDRHGLAAQRRWAQTLC